MREGGGRGVKAWCGGGKNMLYIVTPNVYLPSSYDLPFILMICFSFLYDMIATHVLWDITCYDLSSIFNFILYMYVVRCNLRRYIIFQYMTLIFTCSCLFSKCVWHILSILLSNNIMIYFLYISLSSSSFSCVGVGRHFKIYTHIEYDIYAYNRLYQDILTYSQDNPRALL